MTERRRVSPLPDTAYWATTHHVPSLVFSLLFISIFSNYDFGRTKIIKKFELF
jgi:hypothetical protein